MDAHAQETYKSMLSFSAEGLKALLLINGGAIVSLLTFLGNTKTGKELVQCSTVPLAAFVCGVVAAALAFVFSYATQFALFNETVRPGSYRGPRHMAFMRISLLFVTLGLVAFTVGCFTSIAVLGRYGA